jgi:hypothetical protein
VNPPQVSGRAVGLDLQDLKAYEDRRLNYCEVFLLYHCFSASSRIRDDHLAELVVREDY